MNRGKLAVLLMLGVAVALAGFAWYFNYQKSHGPIAFWGSDGIARIRQAPEVELLCLQSQVGMGDGLMIGGNRYAVSSRVDISRAQGLKNGRDALARDDSYLWSAARQDASPGKYTHALRFRDSSGTTTVAFDFADQRLAHVESGREVKGAAKIIAGWQTFSQRHTPNANSGSQ